MIVNDEMLQHMETHETPLNFRRTKAEVQFHLNGDLWDKAGQNTEYLLQNHIGNVNKQYFAKV